MRETAGVSAHGSQPRSGTVRGTARREYARLPGARLTEKRLLLALHEKRGPHRKSPQAKRCETIRSSCQNEERKAKTWRPVALRDPRLQ